MAETDVNPVETTVESHSKIVNGKERFGIELTIGGEATAAAIVDLSNEPKSS